MLNRFRRQVPSTNVNVQTQMCMGYCSFLTALEANRSCGMTGYPLSIGYKLCTDLEKDIQNFSAPVSSNV